jgi:competence protein ComEA
MSIPVDIHSSVSSRLLRLREALLGLGCTPAECLALAVLVTGAFAALGLLWLTGQPESTPAEQAPTGGAGVVVTSDEIVVHVTGAVSAPGLYHLPGGTRVEDALTAAGGPQPGAALDALNLARPLTDGEQVIVPLTPAPGAASSPQAPSGGPLPAKRPDGTLDLNRATVEELDELPGVGPILAERIVSRRKERGGFTSVGQLRDVPGIGEKTFQELAPLVGV